MAYVDVDRLKRHLVLCYLAVADRPMYFSDILVLVVEGLKLDGPVSINAQLNYMTENNWIVHQDGKYRMSVEGFVHYTELAERWNLGSTTKELRRRLQELL